MINLLPTDFKKQLRASRTNLIMAKYIIVLIIAIVFLGAGCLAVNMNLDNIKKMYDNDSRPVTTSSPANYSARIEEAREHLANSIEIINQQVSYNKILLALAETLPNGVIVSSLVIDSNIISLPVTIKLRAQSQDSVASLNSRFQSSSSFRNYQLLSSNNTSIDPDYPIDLTISVSINKESVK